MGRKGFRKLGLALIGLVGLIAAVQAEAACVGKNLWTEFAKTHPDAARAADELAAKMPFGEGRLFRLTKSGNPVSYVLGTIHIKDARYLPLTGAIRKAFDDTKVTVLELQTVKETAVAKIVEESGPKYLTALLAEAGQRPVDFLTADEQAQINAVGEKAGVPGSYLLTMRPVLLGATLPMVICPDAGKAEDGVDGELEHLSLENAKLVIGLETMFEQLSSFNELPFDVQKEVLHNSLRSLDTIPDALETIKQLYVESRTGRVVLAMYGKIPQFTTMGPVNPPAFTAAILDKRNRRMVQRALPFLSIDSTLVAVGAAHLPGENGILKLFQDAGYKVEKVE